MLKGSGRRGISSGCREHLKPRDWSDKGRGALSPDYKYSVLTDRTVLLSIMLRTTGATGAFCPNCLSAVVRTREVFRYFIYIPPTPYSVNGSTITVCMHQT